MLAKLADQSCVRRSFVHLTNSDVVHKAAVSVCKLTFAELFSGLLKLSSRAWEDREDRVNRADFLCEAGSSDRNSELVSNSIDLLFGVVATGSAPTPLLRRSITILTPKRRYTSTIGGLPASLQP